MTISPSLNANLRWWPFANADHPPTRLNHSIQPRQPTHATQDIIYKLEQVRAALERAVQHGGAEGSRSGSAAVDGAAVVGGATPRGEAATAKTTEGKKGRKEKKRKDRGEGGEGETSKKERKEKKRKEKKAKKSAAE